MKGIKKIVISSNDKRFGSSPMKLTNDLDIDGDKIYFIDSSYERNVNEAIEETIEGLARGRLFVYDEASDNLELIIENLYFPNGLQLMPDTESILINENSMSRIIRYYLKGSKKGVREVFVDLPGFGDTIRLSERETLMVPIVSARHSIFASPMDIFGKYPLVRTLMGLVGFMNTI